MRTLGDRPAPLVDALTSIAAQTDRSLEVMITVHNGRSDDLDAVRNTIQQFSPAFRRQIRLIPVGGRGRGRPLNAGLDAASGHYVAFLDDDDVVLGHWIETFRRLAERSPGATLRASCVDQAFVRDGTAIRQDGPTTLSWPRHFDVLRHLHHNESPICSLAFPLDVLRAHNLRFDEDLAIVEDWDFLLRVIQLTGVADTSEITSIYRRWSVGASAQAHDVAEWDRARRTVLDRLDLSPLVLPPGSATPLAAAHDAPFGGDEDFWLLKARAIELAQHLAHRDLQLADAERQLADVRRSTSWRLTGPVRRLSSLVARWRTPED